MSKVRPRIKQILRRNEKYLNVDGGGFDTMVDRDFDQARVLAAMAGDQGERPA